MRRLALAHLLQRSRLARSWTSVVGGWRSAARSTSRLVQQREHSISSQGYRWSDGSDGRPRSWYVDVGETAVDAEIAFLKTEIYLREVAPRLQTLTAFTRFSSRI